MKSSSGNQGDGTFNAMRETMNKDVNDSHRALTELVGAARDAFSEGLTARQQAGLVRFEQAVARRTLRSTSRVGAWAFGFGVVAVGAAAAVLMFQRGDAMLTFAVVNGTVSDGGYVRAKAEGGTELRFSDGSSLALDPGTSTRVTDIDTHGSRVLLESGGAHVRVTHRPAAKWTIDAGPYSVQVVGTEFDVRWSGSEEVLDVQMHHGAIIVRGPLASGGLTMEAGQHLVANVKDGEIFLDATPGSEAANMPHARAELPEPTFVEPESPAAPTSPTSPTVHATRARPTVVRAVAAPGVDASWSKLIAQGDFRYVRRSDVARRTLLAERNRFPRTVTAREAAFFLGGLAEDESGAASAKTAVEWYERYMADSPTGTYAAQALGRQMILVHKSRGAAAARPIATEYLKHFPSGPYAAPARKLLQD